MLCPGSRSQALALAAAEFERAGLIRLHVRIDERVGGFLALGLAVSSGLPVAVVMTSGTAVANLHPAVLEAHHSGVPLIVLSADRPERLRGIGSNQTTVQNGIFGIATPFSRDIPAPVGAPGETDAAAALASEAWAAAFGVRPQPVHLNLAFTEPLSSATAFPESTGDWSAEPDEPARGRRLRARRSLPGTVVIAGAGAGPRAEEVARELGVPLLAEVSSGARFGPNLVVAYRELLNTGNFGDRVARAIVFGHPTLSREIPALIQRDGVETIVVRSAAAEDYNPGHRVARFVDAVRVDRSPTNRRPPESWLGRWVTASRSAARAAGRAVAPPNSATPSSPGASSPPSASPSTARMLVEAVWRATWPHDRLVLGASRLIREADDVVPGKKIWVHANRGLAGIDGTISTAVGIALGSETDGTTRVLLGDLAALHDAGGLLFGRGETRPRIQVIVGNDGGGTIFDTLEVARRARRTRCDRVLLTPQEVDFATLAARLRLDLPAGNQPWRARPGAHGVHRSDPDRGPARPLTADPKVGNHPDTPAEVSHITGVSPRLPTLR